MSSDTSLQELQSIEEQLTHTVSQKQAYHQYIADIDAALNELSSVDEAFQVVGTIMIKKPSSTLRDDLTSKKESFSSRLSALEKQESRLRDKLHSLQQEAGVSPPE